MVNRIDARLDWKIIPEDIVRREIIPFLGKGIKIKIDSYRDTLEDRREHHFITVKYKSYKVYVVVRRKNFMCNEVNSQIQKAGKLYIDIDKYSYGTVQKQHRKIKEEAIIELKGIVDIVCEDAIQNDYKMRYTPEVSKYMFIPLFKWLDGGYVNPPANVNTCLIL